MTNKNWQNLLNDNFGINKNEPLYLVAGGPSLTGFDFTQLSTLQTIAINRSAEALPHANILAYLDARFATTFPNTIETFQGYQFTAKKNLTTPIVDSNKITLPLYDKYGIGNTWLTIRTGHNSGFFALQLAYLLDVKKVYLLGYDMSDNGNQTHFHSGYKFLHNPAGYANNMIPNFNNTAKTLLNKMEIYNLNPQSKLKCFPYSSYRDAGLVFN